MPLYKGKAYKQFLIDRCAMGFDHRTISEEFGKLMGISITEEEIEKILTGSEPEIRARELELLNELLSQNAFTALYDIKRQLDEVREEARTAGDLKTYAQLTNSALKSIETLIGMTERFKSNQEQRTAIGTQNNILVLNILEKEGALKVIDVDKVKKLLGGEEDAGT